MCTMIKKCSIFLVLITGLVSCKLGSLDDPIIIANIEEEFEIELWEILQKEERKLVFIIHSIEEENCQNSTITAHSLISPRSIKLSIDEIITPSDCIEGNAPATAIVDAPGVVTGIYNLIIDLKKTIINEGQLIANEESYSLSTFTTKGIHLPNKSLLRVPNQTLWGFVHYPSVHEQAIAEEFVNELLVDNTINEPREGYYGYYTYRNSQLSIDEQPGENVIPFILHQNISSEAVQSLVDQYRSDSTGQLEIKVLNSEGEIF